MRILIITPTSMDHMEVGGGVAITYFQLEKQLKERGHEVKVLSSWNGTMDAFSPYMYDKFRVCSASRRNYNNLRNEIKKADRVIISDEFLVLVVVLECIAQSKPLFYGLHTDVHELMKSYLKSCVLVGVSHLVFSFMYNFVRFSGNQMFTTSPSFNRKLQDTYGISSKVIDQSFKDKVFLANDSPESVRKIREGFLGKGQSSSSSRRHIIMYAGRFSKEKRIPLLVKSKPESAVLVIIGDGPDAKSILAFDNGNDVRVVHRMLKAEELRGYYKACDLFVSASNFETYGMTVHESLVCGTPVVVEDAQGYQSQVVNGDNGYLVSFDDHRSTRSVIERALADLRRLNPRVTCKTGVNIVNMITSPNAKGSFWVRHFFGRLFTTVINPAAMLCLVFFEYCIAKKKESTRRESKTNRLVDICIDNLL